MEENNYTNILFQKTNETFNETQKHINNDVDMRNKYKLLEYNLNLLYFLCKKSINLTNFYFGGLFYTLNLLETSFYLLNSGFYRSANSELRPVLEYFLIVNYFDMAQEKRDLEYIRNGKIENPYLLWKNNLPYFKNPGGVIREKEVVLNKEIYLKYLFENDKLNKYDDKYALKNRIDNIYNKLCKIVHRDYPSKNIKSIRFDVKFSETELNKYFDYYDEIIEIILIFILLRYPKLFNKDELNYIKNNYSKIYRNILDIYPNFNKNILNYSKLEMVGILKENFELNLSFKDFKRQLETKISQNIIDKYLYYELLDIFLKNK